MYRGFSRSLHACSWRDQWLVFDSCPWLVGLFAIGMVFLPVLLAVHLFVSFSLRFSWKFDLCVLMPCFSVVYYCAFWAVSIALRKGYVFWPLSTEFCLGLLGCIFCCTRFFCVPVFMSRLDGLDSTGVSQVSWAPEVGNVTSRHFRDLQSCGRWCLLYGSRYWAVTHAVDGDGDDDDDDALELHFVSGSVSVGAVEMVPLVRHGVLLFASPWLTGIL